MLQNISTAAICCTLIAAAALAQDAASPRPCPVWCGPWKGNLAKVARRTAPHCMSDADIEQLITLGRAYNGPDKLWYSEFGGDYVPTARRPRSFNTGDEMWIKSWSTYTKVKILTDAWRIAGGANQAQHEMRNFSIADVRKMEFGTLPISVSANDSGRGQNATRNVHAVLDIAGTIVQPTEKSESQLAIFFGPFTWYGTRGVMNAEFAFFLPEQHPPVIRLVLIADNNKRHVEELDFAQLR